MFNPIPGTPYYNMILPTEKLLSCFKKHNIKATFFVEAVFLLKLTELQNAHPQLKKDFELISEQLKTMIRNGHRIELHLHPYWIDATYDGTHWHLPTFRYTKLQSMPKQQAHELFAAGKQLLEEIAQKVDPDYHIIAFRAGGWGIQPFELLKRCFEDNDIMIDSSVAPGIVMSQDLYHADFSPVPLHLDKYYFDANPTQQAQTSFLEIPIATIKRSLIQRVLNKIITHVHKKDFVRYGDGQDEREANTAKPSAHPNARQPVMLTIEGNNAVYTVLHETHMVARTKDLITVISHPKYLTPNSFAIIDALVAEKKYLFKTIADLYE